MERISPAELPRHVRAAIGARYALGEEIGRGGMATVFVARDIRHERQVAIKVLHPERATSLGPGRFYREIRVAAQLQHPHILPVYDSGARDGVLWFAMPYVQGPTLRQRLRQDGRLQVEETVSILGDLARALAYAHRRGVIHRDVKPENVLLGENGVFLTDFGVAKPLGSERDPGLTLAGLLVGTPTYMSPEQAAADPAMDHRADIYALGVVGYELLAGEPPFAHLPLGSLLAAHILREPEPVERRRAEVPSQLADVIARCLRKEAADRWGSAEELYHALRASLQPVAGSGDGNAAALPQLERARAAFERAAWRDAYDGFTAADAGQTLDAEDLERLGDAAWWVADGPTALRARERAYHGYLQRGELPPAARIALALAEDYIHRLAPAVGQAWLRRAQRHLEGSTDTPELGWVYRLQMQLALADRRPEEALALADRSLDIARRTGDADLQALALQDRGRVLVTLGRVAEGMELIEDAMAAATAGELSPHTTGRTFCNMLSTCERLGDLSRAAEWHEVAHSWSEPHSESGFPGICRVHRAGMLRLRGDLAGAKQEANRAARELESFLFDVAGAAFYELGEIYLRKGDLTAAEAMFGEAHMRGLDPQPGLALLRWAEGDGEAAWAMLQRALAEPGLAALDQAKLLPAMVEIGVGRSQIDAADEWASALESIAATYSTPSLAASAALARGRVELGRGRAREALRELRRAQQIWTALGLPFELARTRGLLARSYSLLGQTEEAELELRAAEATLRRIGADAGTGQVGTRQTCASV